MSDETQPLYPAPCSPRCDNCRWGMEMEMEHRYDQRHCINEESPEAFGDVEASFSCQFFEANKLITHSHEN